MEGRAVWLAAAARMCIDQTDNGPVSWVKSSAPNQRRRKEMSKSKTASRLTWLASLGFIALPLLSACGGTAEPTAVPTAAVSAAATDTPAAVSAASTDTPAAVAGAATSTSVPPSPTVPPTVVAGGEGCAATATKLTWYV